MKIREILKIVQGKLLSGNPDVDIDLSKISIDSRTIKGGEFFIALKGPNFDGNDFVETAFKKGAIGTMVTNRPTKFQVKAGASGFKNYNRRIVIGTRDTTWALENIAIHHRMKFKVPVIGVTGSNGKTTVKDLIWAILSKKYNVLKNEGTKNNHIGVPLTLLKFKTCHEICVLEIGMNHIGEVSLLSKIAKPTIAVITNIGPSHLEYLGDLRGVFKAKREILESLSKGGLLVLNGDDEFLSEIKEGEFDILRFGFRESNDFRATGISVERDRLKFTLNPALSSIMKTTQGKSGVKFTLNLLGTHNIYNALAAIAVASRFRINYESMRKTLFDYKPSHMRLNLKKIDGIHIIDDSYNSNPLSMECALEALKNYPAESRWVVSGDMLELGKYGRYFHKILGEAVARSDAKGLLTFGKFSRITLSQARECGMSRNNLWHCSDHDEAARILRKVVRKGDAVLIKGSRAMRMEKVIEKLKGYPSL